VPLRLPVSKPPQGREIQTAHQEYENNKREIQNSYTSMLLTDRSHNEELSNYLSLPSPSSNTALQPPTPSALAPLSPSGQDYLHLQKLQQRVDAYEHEQLALFHERDLFRVK